MHRHPRLRIVAALAVALLAQLLVVPVASAAAPVPSPGASTIPAGTDYFTNQWNDPLDYSNPEDVSLTRLQFSGGLPSMANGRLTVAGVSQIILSRGDPGAIPTSAVRDPRARSFDGAIYTRVSFRMHSDRGAAGAIGFRTCDTCSDGYRYFNIVPGWHTYDFDMVGTDDLEGWPGGTSRFAGPGWGGTIGLLYLSVAFNTSDKPTVTLDDFSAYAGSGTVGVSIPGSGAVELWQDTNGNTADDGALSPGVNESANRVGTFSAGSTVRVSSGLFRPDVPTRFYTRQGSESSALSGAVTMPRTSTPQPVIVAPSELGGIDFATEIRHDPWEFDQPGDVLTTFNANASVHDGALFGFAGGAKNDPVVLFNLGPRQIDATMYHKIAITVNYDGPFGLEDSPGGGLVGRFIWRGYDGGHEQVSLPIVVKLGRATYVVSFRTSPTTAVLDPSGNREFIGWGTGITTYASMLRFDPHEDPGDRSWQIDDVKLLRDEEVYPTFDIRFRDDAWASGTTATLYADSNRSILDGLGVAIANVAVGPGENSYRWNGGGVGPGHYYVHVAMSRGGRMVSASSTGEVSVQRSWAGTPPATVNLVQQGPTQEQLIAFFTFILRTKFFCGVARIRNVKAIARAPICNQLLGPWRPPKARRR